jgi:transposase
VVAGLRPAKCEAFFRLSTLPGEQAQADWAHFGQVRIGAATRRLSCFVLTLSYSRALWVQFFLDQSLENLWLAHVHAFQDGGGVPSGILYDKLKSVVLERRRVCSNCARTIISPRSPVAPRAAMRRAASSA